MADHAELSGWVNARSQATYTRLYAGLRVEAWAALRDVGWQTQPTEQAVDTPFGPTVAYRWAGEGTPVVFLHGAGTCSLMWAPLIGGLVGRSVIAVDGVGEPGRSVQTAPVRDADDLSAWVGATLDGLGVARAHLVGASYGGYAAVCHALRAPAAVARLALLEPVLDPLAPRVLDLRAEGRRRAGTPRALARASPAHAAHGDPGRGRRPATVRPPRPDPVPPPRPAPPVPVTDAELARVAVPLLLVLGAESPIHDTAALAARVRAARPDATVAVLDAAGHTAPVDAADRVARLLGEFLDRDDVRSGP